MVDPHRPASSAAWTMSQDQIERFVGMERDIQRLREDMTELEADVKDIKRTLAEIKTALAEGRGVTSTWPKAGALLVGTVVVVGALGGWLIAFWKVASNGQ